MKVNGYKYVYDDAMESVQDVEIQCNVEEVLNIVEFLKDIRLEKIKYMEEYGRVEDESQYIDWDTQYPVEEAELIVETE